MTSTPRGGPAENEASVHPFAELLRRYAFAYTAAHDFTVADEIMVDDYRLIMGDWTALGRDDQYKPATAKQYRQFPGLGFAVHDLVIGENRAALFFSEFGRSVVTGGAATWHGVSLYRWNGAQLTECRVEQDYHSRARQLGSGTADPVTAPAVDPWLVRAGVEHEATRVVVESAIRHGSLLQNRSLAMDSEPGDAARVHLAAASGRVLDLFTAGPTAAFHARFDGEYRGGLGDVGVEGAVRLYATGIVQVDDGAIVSGRIVTDRLSMIRRHSGS